MAVYLWPSHCPQCPGCLTHGTEQHSTFPPSSLPDFYRGGCISSQCETGTTCFRCSLLGFVVCCLVFSRTPISKELISELKKSLFLSLSPDCHSQAGSTTFFLHQIVTAVGLSVGLCQLPFEVICSQSWITEPDKNSFGEAKTKIQNFK